MLKLKKKVCEHMLSDWLTGQDMAAIWKSKLREGFRNHAAVRTYYAAICGETAADTAWMVGCPSSVTKAAELLEELVYNDTFDGRYRDAIKSRHDVQDFLQYSSVAKQMSELEALIRQDASPDPAQTSQSGENLGSAAASASVPENGASEDVERSAVSAEAADEKMPAEQAQQWRQHMLKTMQAHIRFVTDKKSQAELEQALKDCPFSLLKGDGTGQVLFFFDSKKYGEAMTRPDLRQPPLRDALYTRLVKAVLTARTEGEHAPVLQTGDLALILDGGRPGNKNKLLAPWKEGTNKEGSAKKNQKDDDEDEQDEDMDEEDDKPTLSCDTLSIAYTEESLAARKTRVRGTGTVKQLETCHVLAPKKLQLPSRARRHYDGSSTGDMIYGVPLPRLADEWHLPWKQKKTVYGKKHIIPVGGKTVDGDEPKEMNRQQNAEEPMCYHSPPLELYEELLNQYFAKLVIDMAPSDGRMAWACLRNRVGYVGITYNADHQSALEERLLRLLEKEMSLAGSAMYNSAYAAALRGYSAAESADENEQEPQPKPKPKPKAKNKPKAKPKTANPKPKTKGTKAKQAGAGTKADDDLPMEDPEEEPDDDEVWDPLADPED